MDYNDVPLFVRVVELGSFTAAAEALGREKSSVSRAITRLEGDLGVRLLQRTTRKLALTDAGQAFYERVRVSMSTLDDAANAVRELGSEPRGNIRVAAPPDASAFGLPEVVAEFLGKHAGIRVEIALGARHVDLVAEGFDMALRAGRLGDSSLIARRIGGADLALFASPAYLERRGRPKRLADLTKHDLILLRGRSQKDTLTLTGPGGDESVEVTARLTADDMSFLSRAAASGAGIALIPAMVARGSAHLKELEVVLPSYRVGGGALHIVLPSHAFVPARVALLRDFLVEKLAANFARVERECSSALAGASRKRASSR
jgi:DNA-binding transcriptional LysR family regulator